MYWIAQHQEARPPQHQDADKGLPQIPKVRGEFCLRLQEMPVQGHQVFAFQSLRRTCNPCCGAQRCTSLVWLPDLFMQCNPVGKDPVCGVMQDVAGYCEQDPNCRAFSYFSNDSTLPSNRSGLSTCFGCIRILRPAAPQCRFMKARTAACLVTCHPEPMHGRLA